MLRMISHVLTLHLVVLYELPDNSAQFLSLFFCLIMLEILFLAHAIKNFLHISNCDFKLLFFFLASLTFPLPTDSTKSRMYR